MVTHGSWTVKSVKMIEQELELPMTCTRRDTSFIDFLWRIQVNPNATRHEKCIILSVHGFHYH